MALSALASFISDGIEELLGDLEGDISNSFTWKGATISCVPNMQLRGSVVIQGGHEHIVAFTLVVLRANFLTADSTLVTVDSTLFTADNQTRVPVAGKLLTFRWKEYKIVTAALDPSGVYIKLDLADRHSGQ